MTTEFNMRATARRLTAAGYPISPAALGNCIRRDAGPPILRITPHGRRAPEQFIDWQDAMNWAINREQPFYKPRLRRSTRHEITNQMEINDQIILYLKDEYPEAWKRWRARHGRHRIDLLNEIATNAIATAAKEFVGIAAHMPDVMNDDNPDGLPFKLAVWPKAKVTVRHK